MTSPATTPLYTIRKTLNHWKDSYKYEIHEDGKKKQLYSVFFTDKDDMAIFSSVTRNLMALTAEYYLRLEDVVGFDTAEGFEKYNLHIKTEFGKVLLSDNLKNIRERSMKLTQRETALIVKTFVCVLNDLLALLKNRFLPVYQYLKVVWKEDLFNAMYINDNFELKVSLLPEMSQLSSIDWKALTIPFEGEVGLIFEEIVANFIRVLSPYLPMKKDKHELMSILPNLTNNNNKKFWDEIFQLPEDLMKPVFLLADVNRGTYEEKIEEAYNLVLEDDFGQFITPNFIAKYNYEEKYSKNLLKLKTEEDFYKFLHNIGLDDMVALYYSREMTTTPAQKLDIEKIETINIQKVDISVIILYDLAHKPFNSLKRLSLQACGITHDSIGVILTWDSASNLESLDFSGNPTFYNLVGSKGCEKIAQSEKMKNLKELNLASCRIDDAAVIHLANSEHLKNLENLDLGFNGNIGIEGLKAINESPNLTKLNTLSLLCNKIGNAGLTELLKPSEYPKKYKSMNLCDCALTIEGIEILGRAECLENLEAVYLDSNDFSVLAGWMSFKALPNLTKLSMQACFLNDAQFEAIMSLFIPEKLAFLDVSYNTQLTLNLDDMAKLKNLKELLIESTLADEKLFEKLIEDGTPYRLEKLSIQKGPLTSRLFETVGKSQLFPNINTLSLDRVSSLQLALVFAYFLSTENSNNLEMLTLFGGQIDLYIFKYCVNNTLYLNNLRELRLLGIFTKANPMVVEIIKSGKTKNLLVFEIVSCSLTNQTFTTLVKHEGVSNLRRLNVSGNLINYQTISKFLGSKLLPKLEYFDIAGNIKDKEQLTKLRKRQEKSREKLTLVIA